MTYRKRSFGRVHGKTPLQPPGVCHERQVGCLGVFLRRGAENRRHRRMKESEQDHGGTAPARSRKAPTRVCRPSANSSIIFLLKTGMSSGLREVTRPLSTTHS